MISFSYFAAVISILGTCCFDFVSLSQSTLSCYQCVVFTNKECGPESLLPCPLSSSDRCVTNISKDKKQGFMLKRECGLGPCSFDDEEANRGLGWGSCDRNKEEFFCVSCCRESGCNKSSAKSLKSTLSAVLPQILILSYMFKILVKE